MEWIVDALDLGFGGGGLADLVEAAANLVVLVVAPAAAWLAARYVRGHRIREAAYDAVSAAVAETYETFVREAKARAADGRLSSADRREAVRQALGRAKVIARQRGVDLAREYGDDILRGLVQQVVALAKSRARARARTA